MKITKPITLTICINGVEYTGELFAKTVEKSKPNNETEEKVIKTELEDDTPLPIIDESVEEPTIEEDKTQNSSSASSENEDTQMTL